MNVGGKLDVIAWGHSDQTGGAQMACEICSAILKRARIQFKTRLSGGVVTCRPKKQVMSFCGVVGGRNAIKVIEAPELLRLVTNRTQGGVSVVETHEALKKLLETHKISKTKTHNVAKTPLKTGSRGDPLVAIVNDGVGRIRKVCHEETLVISCGEPVALEVARELGLASVIVTDHLITHSVTDILRVAGSRVSAEEWEFIARMKAFDRSADAAFLSPPEFGIPEYQQYFARECNVKCMEMGGMFYDPLPRREMRRAPHFDELEKLATRCPIVIAFGGGGRVWDGIYVKLHKEAMKGRLDEAGFALIMRKVSNGKVVPRSWQLLTPDGRRKDLKDPGKMMYWYQVCTLLVGRGGLAAQQILSTKTSSRDKGAPAMLFVEEPRHSQIESERQMLTGFGLVHSVAMEAFRKNPIAQISETLGDEQARRKMRALIPLRYKPGTLETLADYLLEQYVFKKG